MLQRSILCMQGTQYAPRRSILCRGAFCGSLLQCSNYDILSKVVNTVTVNGVLKKTVTLMAGFATALTK